MMVNDIGTSTNVIVMWSVSYVLCESRPLTGRLNPGGLNPEDLVVPVEYFG